MSKTPSNTALWLPAKREHFSVGPAPYTSPRSHEIVIRNRALAVNPFDRLIQSVGDLITAWIRYPFIVGTDLAGEVVEVGSDVTRFRAGDRVLAFAAGTDPKRNRAAESAFQTHSIVLEYMAAPIPDSMSYEEACVLPLAVCTAACGLFQEDFLAMRHPTANSTSVGQTLLVWGGSTSVGCNAIQLAAAAGYDVVTTCSPSNFEFVRELGARAAFDYRSPTVNSDVIAALKDRELVGALSIGPSSGRACVEILSVCRGKKFVAMVSPPASFDAVPRGKGRLARLLPVLTQMIAGSVALAWAGYRKQVRRKMVWGSELINNAVGPMIFRDYLPSALSSGRFRPAPRAQTVGHGLDFLPEALERQKAGVSATKLIVTL